jgi:hypothetical protein
MVSAISRYLAEGTVPIPGPYEQLSVNPPHTVEVVVGQTDGENSLPQEFGEQADQSEPPHSNNTLVFVNEYGAWQEVDSRILCSGEDSDDELIDISYDVNPMTGQIQEQVFVEL